MKKFLMVTILSVIATASWADGGQINGNILNQTSAKAYFCQLNVASGTWHGPQEGGVLDPIPPSTPAGYSQTSSGGSILTYFTVQDTSCGTQPSSLCTFQMGYNSGSGYNSKVISHQGSYTCSIDEIQGCDSCLNFKISSS